MFLPGFSSNTKSKKYTQNTNRGNIGGVLPPQSEGILRIKRAFAVKTNILSV